MKEIAFNKEKNNDLQKNNTINLFKKKYYHEIRN